VYVLGAIEPAERAEVDAHLPACSRCRDEVAALAGLPALLGRISEEQLSQVADPPEELLDSLLATAAAERPNRRRHRAFLAVAAVFVLLVGALLGGLLVPGARDEPPVARATQSAPAAGPTATTPPLEARWATDPGTHVSAWVGIRAQEWGTALTVRLKGARPGVRCRLFAVAKDGHRDAAGAWRVQYGGYHGYEEFPGSTMISRADLAGFEIITTDHRKLVTIPA
jgi:anti-sigma factor RsiW